MSEEIPSQVLGSLPKSRPHRRSDKRKAKPTAAAEAAEKVPASQAKRAPTAKAAPKPPSRARTAAGSGRLRQPPQPAGTPAARSQKGAGGGRRPAAAPRKPAAAPSRGPGSTGAEIVGTAVQAAAELAEIGLSVSARALRGAVSRLPRP